MNIVATGLTPFLLAQGRSRLAATILGTGIGLNLLLDPLFIFGFTWGIVGAAWATTISSFTAAALAVSCILRNNDIRLRLCNMHLSWYFTTFSISPSMAWLLVHSLSQAIIWVLVIQTVSSPTYNCFCEPRLYGRWLYGW